MTQHEDRPYDAHRSPEEAVGLIGQVEGNGR